MVDATAAARKVKVLFVMANPRPKAVREVIRTDNELRSVIERLQSTKFRESIEVITAPAAQPLDLLELINRHNPDVVHFSGHGTSDSDLVFCDSSGKPHIVDKKAVVNLFATAGKRVRLVILNSCFSQKQARGIAKKVSCAIGMSDEIGDESARTFAEMFYSAIGHGKSVRDAFDEALAALGLVGSPDTRLPKLYSRDGVDPAALTLVNPR